MNSQESCPWQTSRNARRHRPFYPHEFLASHNGESPRLPDDMSAEGNNAPHLYDDPRDPSGMASTSSESSARSRSNGSSSSAANLLPQEFPFRQAHSDPQPDFEKLERAYGWMKAAFCLLVTLCVLVIVVYVVLIVLLLVKLSSGLEAEGTGGTAEWKDCVDEAKIAEFVNIGDAGDDNCIMKEGFEYNSRDRRYCFTSLQWVPCIMGKINDRVQKSVSYIENQQNKINQTVNSYISANKSDSLCSTSNTKIPVLQDVTDPAKSVFAHFFVNVSAHYHSGTQQVLWVLEGQKMSSRNNVVVSSERGEVIIKHSGFYFLYTSLVFNSTSSKAHRVIRTRNSEDIIMLESLQGGVSYIQGVFQLHTDDKLKVLATAGSLDRSRDRMSYFGLYLIRT